MITEDRVCGGLGLMEQEMTEGGDGPVLYHRGNEAKPLEEHSWHINLQHCQDQFCPLTSPR